MRLWIVSPSYHDTACYERLRADLREVCASLQSPLARQEVTFIFVDDTAGQDGDTPKIADDTEIIRPPYNLGHQGALVFALRALSSRVARDDLIVTLDSDGEDRPGDLPDLIRDLLTHPTELHRVCVARRTKRSESLAFKAFYFGYKMIFRLLAGTVVRSGNFVAFRGWLIQDVIFHPHFDLSYASAFVSLPLQVTYVPLPRGKRYAGRSKMPFFSLLTHGFRMLLPFADRIAVRGLLASSAAFACAGAGGVAALARGWGWPALSAFAGLGLAALILASACCVVFLSFSQSKGRALLGLHAGG